MSISAFYSQKSVCILGTELMTGMLLLRQFIVNLQVDKIYILLKTKNNSFDSKSQPPEETKLFKFLGLTQEQMNQKVQVVRFIESEISLITEKEIKNVDVIFNCYMPVELQSKTIYRHVLFPRKLVKYLEEKHRDTPIVVLSSIYSQ
jgi:hypothetical protein